MQHKSSRELQCETLNPGKKFRYIFISIRWIVNLHLLNDLFWNENNNQVEPPEAEDETTEQADSSSENVLELMNCMQIVITASTPCVESNNFITDTTNDQPQDEDPPEPAPASADNQGDDVQPTEKELEEELDHLQRNQESYAWSCPPIYPLPHP